MDLPLDRDSSLDNPPRRHERGLLDDRCSLGLVAMASTGHQPSADIYRQFFRSAASLLLGCSPTLPSAHAPEAVDLTIYSILVLCNTVGKPLGGTTINSAPLQRMLALVPRAVSWKNTSDRSRRQTASAVTPQHGKSVCVGHAEIESSLGKNQRLCLPGDDRAPRQGVNFWSSVPHDWVPPRCQPNLVLLSGMALSHREFVSSHRQIYAIAPTENRQESDDGSRDSVCKHDQSFGRGGIGWLWRTVSDGVKESRRRQYGGEDGGVARQPGGHGRKRLQHRRQRRGEAGDEVEIESTIGKLQSGPS